MAKSGNSMNNNKSRSSKPYDASNSFVKKVASRVTGLIPQSPSWLSGWFSPSSESNQVSSERQDKFVPNEDGDEFQDAYEQPPPAKRIKMPDTQQYSKDGYNRGPSNAQGEGGKRLVQGEFLDVSSVPGPSGYQARGSGFVASTPAETGISCQEPKANGDDRSESGESTSGCSSLEPQMNRGLASSQPGSQIRQSDTHCSRKRLLDDKLKYSYLQNPRSLFMDRSIGARNNQSISRRNNPSFCVNTFGSPLFGDRSSLNDLIVNSPFYAGRTMYGGASSYRRSLGSASMSSSPANSEKLARHTIKVKPSSSQSAVDTNMSQTARRILATLEQFSTPVLDAKRIPVSPQEPALAGTGGRKRPRSDDVGEPRLLLEQARTPQRTNKPLHWAGGAPNTTKLTVPAAPDTLVMRRRERLQDSTTSARLMASAAPVTDMTCGLEAYKLRTESNTTSNKQSLKMKAPPRTRREKEPAEPEMATEINLPKIALPISSLPSFDISVPPAPSPATDTARQTPLTKLSNPSNTSNSLFAGLSKKLATTPSPKPKQMLPSSAIPSPSDAFSFASPTPIRVSTTGKDHPVSPVNNFTFSKPLPIANCINFAPKLKCADPKSDSFPCGVKPASELRTGSVMDILGKGNSETKSKEVNGGLSLMDKFKPAAGSWECDKCMIRNESDVNKCAACTNPRETSSTLPANSTSVTTSVVSAKSNSGFGSQFKLSSGMWECSSCMVRNKDGDVKCVACTAPKPSVKSVNTTASPKAQTTTASGFSGWGDKFKPAGNTWDCEACMVRNGAELTACQACTTKRPGASVAPVPAASSNTSPHSGWGDKFKKPQGSWDCGVCMISNKGSDLKCAACQASKPGTESAPPSATTNAPKFSFGIPASDVKGSKDVASGFTFGVNTSKEEKEKSTSVSSSTGFKIGENASSTPVVNFSFGIPATTTSTPSSIPAAVPLATTAGGPTTKPAEITKPVFSFGVPNSSAEKPNEVAKPTMPSLFGMSASQPSSTSGKMLGGSPVGEKRKHSDDAPSSSAVATFKFGSVSQPPVASTPVTSAVSSGVSSTSGAVFSFTAASGAGAGIYSRDTTTTSTASTSHSSFETSSTVSPSAPFPRSVSSPTSSAASKPAVAFSLGSTLSKDESVTSTWKPSIVTTSSAPANADSTITPAAPKPLFSFGGPVSSSGMAFGSGVTKTSVSPTFSFGSSTDSKETTTAGNSGLTFGSPASCAAPAFGATSSIAPSFGTSSNSTFGTTAPAGNGTASFGESSTPAASFGSTSTVSFGSSFGSVTEEKKTSTFAFGGATTTQAGTGPQTAPSGIFTFGNSAPTSNGPSAKPDFGFGSASSASATFGGFGSTPANPSQPRFNFGPSQTVGAGFGSPNPASATPAAPSPFGGAPATSNTPPFGAPSTPAFSSFGVAAAPSSGGFNFSPATNLSGGFGTQASQSSAGPAAFTFGQPQTQCPPAFDPNVKPSFNFTGGNAVACFAASPSDTTATSAAPPGPRRIKKAMRRAPQR